MKANELRIGNYIELPNGNITKVGYEIIRAIIILNPTPKYKPIPLTEQWLVDFGAREYLGSKRSFKYSRFDLFWRKDYKYWYVTDFEDETYMTKIEFVHEFQNFIFAMDQEELKIKTTSSNSQ